MSRTLRSHFRIQPEKEADYVANGSALRYRESGANLRHFGLDPQKYILSLGRLSPEKNCHLLIEAFEGLDTDVNLVFGGGVSYTDEYAATLRKHASDRILFLDWWPEMRSMRC